MFRVLTLSTFNVEAFRGYLTNLAESPKVEAVDTGFGQAAAILAHGTPPEPVDAAVVWTRPEDVCPSFRRLLEGDSQARPEDCATEAADFARAIVRFAGTGMAVMVCAWVVAPSIRSHGTIAATLAVMNGALAAGLGTNAKLRLMDTSRWIAAGGARAWSAKSWHLGKNPFTSDVHRAAARDVRAVISALMGLGRKLLVLDLDDTLWGGILGDEGWKSVRIGGHDAIGEAYAEFQRELLALKRRGILLAIASKNDESVVVEAFAQRDEMVLGLEDFSAIRIDWNDKAGNVASIARELNLGLQSTVFIDDSPIERARVREALPEVLVPEWPSDPFLYVQALRDLDCFEAGALTDEDRARGRLYDDGKRREASRQEIGSYDDWLRTLDMKVKAERLDPGNRERIVQLMNKTNQLNLSTRRITDADLDQWMANGTRELWGLRVSDRFGDAGLTGILGVELADGTARIVDWVLSCRVMGRRVEETLVALAAERARESGAISLVAEFLPTAKNAPTLEFFERSGLARDGNVFVWDLARPYPIPESVRLER